MVEWEQELNRTSLLDLQRQSRADIFTTNTLKRPSSIYTIVLELRGVTVGFMVVCGWSLVLHFEADRDLPRYQQGGLSILRSALLQESPECRRLAVLDICSGNYWMEASN